MSPMDEWLEKAKRDAAEKVKAEKEARPKGQKCSNCMHHQGHPFSERYNYCTLGRSNKTNNGFATTKRGGWCARWNGGAA